MCAQASSWEYEHAKVAFWESKQMLKCPFGKKDLGLMASCEPKHM